MNGFLLDTNVVSELTKKVPDKRVLGFLSEHDELWLSTVVLHELYYGIGLLLSGRRRDGIVAVLSAFVTEYGDRILPVGYSEAIQAAEFRAQKHNSGGALDVGDALIAGTAKVNALAIATRNVRDFEYLGLEVVNPWESP